MMIEKYEKIIYWSAEDNCFIAEVPELEGRMAHGASDIEALQNIKEAIELYLESCKELGEEVPAPKGRKFIFA